MKDYYHELTDSLNNVIDEPLSYSTASKNLKVLLICQGLSAHPQIGDFFYIPSHATQLDSRLAFCDSTAL